MRQCESKLKLLRTAHELIWQQSYGAVGVDQICDRSGVKKGSFYHFFRSKSELTVAAYEHYWVKVRERFDQIFLSGAPVLDRLEAYFDHIRQTQVDRFDQFGRILGCPYASLGSELSTQDEAIRRMAQEISERKIAYYEAALQEAMDCGDLPKVDAGLLARELHSYIAGLVQEAKIANDLRVLDRLKPGAYRIIGLPTSVLAV